MENVVLQIYEWSCTKQLDLKRPLDETDRFPTVHVSDLREIWVQDAIRVEL